MESVLALINQYKAPLEKTLYDKNQPWTSKLALVEERTGVPRTYLVLGAVGFVALWLAFGYAAQLLCNVIGFAYPAYVSMKALETRSKDDDTKWLTYWVVFAWFSVVEFFSNIVLGWIPVYWLLKCMFLVWCMAPIESNGATIIYTKVIRGIFLKHQSKIDATLGKISSSANKLVGDMASKKD